MEQCEFNELMFNYEREQAIKQYQLCAQNTKDLAATDSQQPQAEIAWCKEAFAIARTHAVNSDYAAMWHERENAVLAQLSAVR